MIGRYVGFHAGMLIGVASFAIGVLASPSAPVKPLPSDQMRTIETVSQSLVIEDGTAIVVVNAPDGPTLETRKELEQARNSGVQSLMIWLQMTGLTQDEDLMALFRQELVDLAAEYGFAGEKYRLRECLEVCK